MKDLKILTNNHLGNFFWEQRTGLIDSIELDTLDLNTFLRQLEKKSTFILLDFYFSKIPMTQELQMIDEIKQMVKTYAGELNLFILSPLFANSELGYLEFNSKTIVTHNFTTCFLKTLLTAGKINQQIKVS
jgi:hypothetical protein